jgi:hypothetical protein
MAIYVSIITQVWALLIRTCIEVWQAESSTIAACSVDLGASKSLRCTSLTRTFPSDSQQLQLAIAARFRPCSKQALGHPHNSLVIFT